ncbi:MULTISPECIES: hypothetical protein [Helicobacter]|uniref:Periplasmic protein n=1 Tax=Helicobacter ibis TaxID=2962633 RepID=A0ABT4VCM4_9HELI|nr:MULTISPECIES: hypothetical protein [Helicobacter]MDA3966769.1 hypothetical protein [Helicobacter sp. WB40]MDA3968449.1 hypothetical protein [Helicobacter ibis]
MVIKSLFLFFVIFSHIIFANEVNKAIVSFIGDDNYKINQKFIERIFANEHEFLYPNSKANLQKIAQTLKQNGLLNLSFNSPMELEVAFYVSHNPSAFIGSLYDILQSMGYYYFLVKQSVLEGDRFRFVLSMNTEYAIDPVLLQGKLRDYGYVVSDIERRSISQWIYNINATTFAMPKSIPLIPNVKSSEASLQGEYWYNINVGSKISLSANYGVLWYPEVVFYDKDLRILEIFTSQKQTRAIDIDIPKDTKFIKISDTYLPIIIKNGLSVVLE